MEIKVIPAGQVTKEPFWSDLYKMIQDSFKFKNKDMKIFPDSFTRLDPNIELGAATLERELGPDGWMAIGFIDDQPVTSAGFLPYNVKELDLHAAGEVVHVDAVKQGQTFEATNGSVTGWEIIMAVTARAFQGRRLFDQIEQRIEAEVRKRGGTKLYAGFVEIENGGYWRARGYHNDESCDRWLPKGFSHNHGEGLHGAVLLRTSWRALS